MADKNHNPTLRVLNILQSLAENRGGITLTEIARLIDSPKSTLVPILNTMREQGFIHFDSQTSRYQLGIKSYTTGVSYLNEMSALQFIRSEMQRVVKKCAETCQMGLEDHGEVLYVAIEEPDTHNRLRLASSIGQRLPMYCTALGKVLLSAKDPEELAALYPDALTAFTKNTITEINKLRNSLADVAKNGYAIDDAEIQDDLKCVAVPLLKHSQIVGAVSVSFPLYRTTDERFDLALHALLELQNNIRTYLETNDVDVSNLVLHSSST